MNKLRFLIITSIVLGFLVTLFLIWDSFQVYTHLRHFDHQGAYRTLDFHFIYTIENIIVFFLLLWGIYKMSYSHHYLLFTVPMILKSLNSAELLIGFINRSSNVPIIYVIALIVAIGSFVTSIIILERVYYKRYTKLTRLKISIEENKKDIISYIAIYNAERRRLNQQKKDNPSSQLTA